MKALLALSILWATAATAAPATMEQFDRVCLQWIRTNQGLVCLRWTDYNGGR